MNLAEDIANEALDLAGVEFTIGDLKEGTDASRVLIRHYSQCMRQLLRMAMWDFARKKAPMLLLADASGQTPSVGTVVCGNFLYEYALPSDCMRARFVPRNPLNVNQPPAGNISVSSAPPTTNSTTVQIGASGREYPAPFIVTMDVNYPIPPESNWLEQQGESPAGRVVILTSVKQAALVYTAFMPYPSVWDSQFRQAMVAYLAAQIALPLNKDKKFGMTLREANLKIAREKVIAAQVSNGNEANFPSTTDIIPDWMRIRSSGAGSGGGAGWGGGLGGAWGANGFGWDGCGFLGYGYDSSF